jgi:4-aminobutyrate aminotransferase-like enzyme
MGNGFPVAALVVRSEVLASVPEETELFSTFGGNPVACAAALAVLDVIEDEGLAALAQRHPLIGDVRGEGLLIGVELAQEAGISAAAGARTPAGDTPLPATASARRVTEALRQRGILISATGPDGNVLKIRPPLVFQREHADILLQALDDALTASAGETP